MSNPAKNPKKTPKAKKSIPTPKKAVKRDTKPTVYAKVRERKYALCNTSCSDYELIVSDHGENQHYWMTPNKTIHVSFGPLTPQVQEFQRRHMLSVTEVQI